MSDVIVKMEGISKAFAGIKALDHVQIELRKGEVHALMGENGAGKSTLMKIMTGVYSKDEGSDEITANGTESRIKHGFSGTEPLGKYEYSRKYFYRQRAGRKKQAAGQGHTE